MLLMILKKEKTLNFKLLLKMSNSIYLSCD